MGREKEGCGEGRVWVERRKGVGREDVGREKDWYE